MDLGIFSHYISLKLFFLKVYQIINISAGKILLFSYYFFFLFRKHVILFRFLYYLVCIIFPSFPKHCTQNINLINHILCVDVCTVFPWWGYMSIQKACCRCPAGSPPHPQYCLASPPILIKRWPFSLYDSCPSKCATLEQKGWRKSLHLSCPLPSLARPRFPGMPAGSAGRRWNCAVTLPSLHS